MTTGPAGDSLPGALLQLAALDEREAGHFAQLREVLNGQQDVIGQLAEDLAGLAPPGGGPGYQPIPAITWWTLDDEQREQAAARISSWVTSIYRPLYGHLAAGLGGCWPAHPLALITLDWLSELWSVLYLKPTRTARDLAAQAELGTRILPAAAALLAAETRDCPQHRSPASGRAAAGTWP